MLELGSTPPAADLIKDVTEANFMADVVEASQEVPVIVDFWAPWCGPCKTLGPMLEDAVTKAGGAVKMAKIDVDQNQMLAQALAQQGLPLQSIPTVVAFVKGRPTDMFQGAVPASEIDAFIKRAIEAGGGDASGGLDEALAAAEEMLAEGAVEDAAQTFAAIAEEDPMNADAFGGLARCHVAAGALEQALENWDLQRVALVDRCVLEVGAAEILYFPDVPLRVIIDEAVDVVRKFSTDESGAFVNGVLDRIAREASRSAADSLETES